MVRRSNTWKSIEGAWGAWHTWICHHQRNHIIIIREIAWTAINTKGYWWLSILTSVDIISKYFAVTPPCTFSDMDVVPIYHAYIKLYSNIPNVNQIYFRHILEMFTWHIQSEILSWPEGSAYPLVMTSMVTALTIKPFSKAQKNSKLVFSYACDALRRSVQSMCTQIDDDI